MYSIRLTKQAAKDYDLIKAAKLDTQVKKLLELMKKNPYQSPPPFEKLIGDLAGAYSRRITIKHRLVYKIDTDTKTIIILRLWTHYD
jgi:Txe/YoeB family toxin of toxin-antitoxin system